MQITPDIIRHIARLARLHLTDAEVTKFTAQMGNVVGYFDKLNELDLDDVPETNQVTGLVGITRPDVVAPFPASEELIRCSRLPVEDNQIKVKKTI